MADKMISGGSEGENSDVALNVLFSLHATLYERQLSSLKKIVSKQGLMEQKHEASRKKNPKKKKRAMQKIMKTLESDDSVATTTAAHYQHLVSLWLDTTELTWFPDLRYGTDCLKVLQDVLMGGDETAEARRWLSRNPGWFLNRATWSPKEADKEHSPQFKGASALHIAAFWGALNTLKLMLATLAGIDAGMRQRVLDATTVSGQTALAWAAMVGVTPAVQALLDASADPNYCAAPTPRPGLPDPSAGGEDQKADTDGAASNKTENKTEKEKKKNNKQADDPTTVPDLDVRGTIALTPLMEAALHGRADILRLLLQKKAHIGATLAPRHETPLHFAAGALQPATTKLLLELKADPNLVTADGLSPLDAALVAGESALATTGDRFGGLAPTAKRDAVREIVRVARGTSVAAAPQLASASGADAAPPVKREDQEAVLQAVKAVGREADLLDSQGQPLLDFLQSVRSGHPLVLRLELSLRGHDAVAETVHALRTAGGVAPYAEPLGLVGQWVKVRGRGMGMIVGCCCLQPGTELKTPFGAFRSLPYLTGYRVRYGDLNFGPQYEGPLWVGGDPEASVSLPVDYHSYFAREPDSYVAAARTSDPAAVSAAEALSRGESPEPAAAGFEVLPFAQMPELEREVRVWEPDKYAIVTRFASYENGRQYLMRGLREPDGASRLCEPVEPEFLLDERGGAGSAIGVTTAIAEQQQQTTTTTTTTTTTEAAVAAAATGAGTGAAATVAAAGVKTTMTTSTMSTSNTTTLTKVTTSTTAPPVTADASADPVADPALAAARTHAYAMRTPCGGLHLPFPDLMLLAGLGVLAAECVLEFLLSSPPHAGLCEQLGITGAQLPHFLYKPGGLNAERTKKQQAEAKAKAEEGSGAGKGSKGGKNKHKQITAGIGADHGGARSSSDSAGVEEDRKQTEEKDERVQALEDYEKEREKAHNVAKANQNAKGASLVAKTSSVLAFDPEGVLDRSEAGLAAAARAALHQPRTLAKFREAILEAEKRAGGVVAPSVMGGGGTADGGGSGGLSSVGTAPEAGKKTGIVLPLQEVLLSVGCPPAGVSALWRRLGLPPRLPRPQRKPFQHGLNEPRDLRTTADGRPCAVRTAADAFSGSTDGKPVPQLAGADVGIDGFVAIPPGGLTPGCCSGGYPARFRSAALRQSLSAALTALAAEGKAEQAQWEVERSEFKEWWARVGDDARGPDNGTDQEKQILRRQKETIAEQVEWETNKSKRKTTPKASNSRGKGKVAFSGSDVGTGTDTTSSIGQGGGRGGAGPPVFGTGISQIESVLRGNIVAGLKYSLPQPAAPAPAPAPAPEPTSAPVPKNAATESLEKLGMSKGALAELEFMEQMEDSDDMDDFEAELAAAAAAADAKTEAAAAAAADAVAAAAGRSTIVVAAEPPVPLAEVENDARALWEQAAYVLHMRRRQKIRLELNCRRLVGLESGCAELMSRGAANAADRQWVVSTKAVQRARAEGLGREVETLELLTMQLRAFVRWLSAAEPTGSAGLGGAAVPAAATVATTGGAAAGVAAEAELMSEAAKAALALAQALALSSASVSEPAGAAAGKGASQASSATVVAVAAAW